MGLFSPVLFNFFGVSATLVATPPPVDVMDNAFRYWQLVRLDNSGRCRSQVLAPVQTWLREAFADWLSDTDKTDGQLQSQLLTIWQSGQAEADLALLSLRCFVSHQIRLVCVHLVNQFGDRHGLTTEELLPYVLDDDGQPPAATYTPLTLEILQSYDPAKAKLTTWATRLTKNHPELNRVLLEKNLYRVSDWAILNDTSLEQLRRVLEQYHLYSPAEVDVASQLLSGYHQVYRRQRLQLRQSGKATGRCQPPTPEQLQQISSDAPKQVLAQLKALAAQLRQYRIHARGGNPAIYGGEEVDWERLPNPHTSAASEGENAQAAFLDTYRQELRQCLDEVLAEAIRAYMAKLARRKPPKDNTYVEGLERFHCRGQSMGAIATDLGLTNQVQVTRLLQLKRLREEVQALLIPRLQERVQTLAQRYLTVDELQQRQAALNQLLAQEVEQVIAAATSEAQIPQGRTANSLFAQTLCQTVHQFLAPAQSP